MNKHKNEHSEERELEKIKANSISQAQKTEEESLKTKDWQSNIDLWTRGPTTTVPLDNVYGLGVKISSLGLSYYTGSSWVAVVLTAQIKDGTDYSKDHYVLQASIGYDTTYHPKYGYGVFDVDKQTWFSQNSTGDKPLDDYWLQIFYNSTDQKWYLQVVDATTSTIVWQYKFTDSYGGTQVRTAPYSVILQDWADVESNDTDGSKFPSGFVIYFYYAQWMDSQQGWHSLSQAYTSWHPQTPSNLYIQARSGSTAERFGVLGSGTQSDDVLINV